MSGSLPQLTDWEERAKLHDRLMVEARRQRWYCWVTPATGVGDNWEAHFNWQSVWTSCGLNYDGERAFNQAVEMVREAYADRARRIAA